MSEINTVTWYDIGSLSDIPIRGARRVTIKKENIAVFRTQSDEVFAVEDKCPHNGGPLSDGIVHGDCVTCPLHNWIISLRDGKAQGADVGQTRQFRIRNKEQRLLLSMDIQET